MLIDLHIDEEAVKSFKDFCKKEGCKEEINKPFDLQEKGFCLEEDTCFYKEVNESKKFDEFNYFKNKYDELAKKEGLKGWLEYEYVHNIDIPNQYGVADNAEQIKEYYKKEIEDPNDKFCIAIRVIFQEKENAGKGGGWRWHKWGPYIGTLKPEYEYLDDEDFGPDFQGYIICFHLLHIL